MSMKYFLLILLTCIAFACTPTKTPNVTVQRVPAKFDYSPPSRVQSGVTNLSIALIKPRFIGDNPEYYVAPFNEMATSMASDFEELLTAKGFTIRGPFGSRDEMVYSDKTSSSFALEVSIDLLPLYKRNTKYTPGIGNLIMGTYKTSGEVTLSGNLVITASSPQQGEKIWKKSIALQRYSFTYAGSQKWREIPSMADELKLDSEVYNTLTRELEKFYAQALDLAWRQIEAAEMKGVADQAKKADKRG
jgi:hypothetical protein